MLLFCLESTKIWRWKSLNYTNKSKRRLFAVTALTVVAIASVLSVYAVMIGTFTGGEVTIGTVASSTVTYSLDNSSYTTTLSPSSTSTAWYTRLEIGSGSYNGPVQITWQLQQKTTGWADIGTPQTTNIVLSGNAEDVYASTDGASTTNYDWSSDVTTAGTYRVVATVESD